MSCRRSNLVEGILQPRQGRPLPAPVAGVGAARHLFLVPQSPPAGECAPTASPERTNRAAAHLSEGNLQQEMSPFQCRPGFAAKAEDPVSHVSREPRRGAAWTRRKQSEDACRCRYGYLFAIRNAVSLRDARSAARGLPCGAADPRGADLPEWTQTLLSDALCWFNEHLPVPPAEAMDHRAIFWFHRPSVAVRQMWQLVSIFREEGVHVALRRTDAPGRVVYCDDFQVAAIPYGHGRRRRRC